MSTEIATKDDFLRLEKQVEEMYLQFTFINSKLLIPKVVTVKDICILEGISKSTACIHKYYLPRFGESPYEGHARWDWDEYIEWHNRPIEERKKEYQAMTQKKNQRVV